MTDETLERLYASIGYRFRDPGLLTSALTHRSHASESGALTSPATAPSADNERLEFLGDAVLGLVVAEMLFARAPGASEGELSRLRAAVVNEASLAAAAARWSIGDALRLGRGEHRTGGRTRPSTLADALEAVFAAVYLDGGIQAARDAIGRGLASRLDEVLMRGARDEKSALQELLQARHKITPRYDVVGSFGPDHDREYEVQLQAGDVVSARGRGRSKKEAALVAARVALAELEARGSSNTVPGAPSAERPSDDDARANRPRGGSP